MTSPQAFIAVPTDGLVIDPQVDAQNPTASEQLRHWMSDVARIYEMLQQGYSDVDFRRMSDSPAPTRESELAESYRHLFSTSPSAEALRARFTDGVGLQVVSGQSRVRAARAAGVDYLPVHVEAPDDDTLAAVTRQLESEVAQIAPNVIDVHRIYDSRHREMRDGAQAPEVARRSGDRHETDRPWVRPEQER